MRVCFDKRTGAYCDSSDSFKIFPGDEAFIKGDNVMGRFGGTVDDFVVIETDIAFPHLKKWVDGKLVDDKDKMDEMEAQETDVQTEAQHKVDLRAKIAAGTSTREEEREYMLLLGG